MKLYTKKNIALSAALTILCSAGTGFAAAAADNPTGDTMLRGNLNGDVAVTAEDAQLALNAATELLTGNESGLDSDQLLLADVDSDGNLTVKDAQLILQYYVLNTVTGIPTEWDALLNASRPENIVPETGDKLRILCWTDYDVKPMIEAFLESNQQYENKIAYVNAGSYGAEAREAYARYFALGTDADLYVTEADWIHDYIDGDQYARPITDLGFTEADFDKCYPYTLSVGRDPQGVLKAVTWMATPGGYVYRSDLAKQYFGVSSPEEMQPLVKDWDTFMETAGKLKTASSGKTKMLSSRADWIQPWLYSAHEDPVGINRNLTIPDEYRTFYDRLSSSIANQYYVSTSAWTDEWYKAGVDDTALGYFFCTWCLGQGAMLENAEGGIPTKGTYGKYNITEGPQGWFWGGSWLSLAANADNGTIAHDFIEHFVITTGTMLDYAKKSNTFVNNYEAMQDLDVPNPLLGGQSEFAVLDRSAKAIDLGETVSPYTFKFAEMFSESALKTRTYEEAVSDFKAEVKRHYPEIRLN